ncbi:MFS transporter [Streptomyces sviceus]|uniref:MFS transporter n=1 Tax=Streptomyces sviceus TaxID=285530 RepID=UPI00368AE1A8
MALRVCDVVGEGRRVSTLSTVLSVGALVAAFASPLLGALSDRTTLRLGKRRTWLVIGPLVELTGLACIGLGGAVWLLVVGWVVAQAGGVFDMFAVGPSSTCPVRPTATTSAAGCLLKPTAWPPTTAGCHWNRPSPASRGRSEGFCHHPIGQAHFTSRRYRRPARTHLDTRPWLLRTPPRRPPRASPPQRTGTG